MSGRLELLLGADMSLKLKQVQLLRSETGWVRWNGALGRIMKKVNAYMGEGRRPSIMDNNMNGIFFIEGFSEFVLGTGFLVKAILTHPLDPYKAFVSLEQHF